MSEKLSVRQNDSQKEMHSDSSSNKKHFTEPKLTFTEPKLTKHGDATRITAGFFGSFYPA